MARFAIRLAAVLFLALSPAFALASDDVMTFGGDAYASGQMTTLDVASPRSAFVAGFTASIDGPVGKDAHVVGAHVSVDGPVAGDLYAAGAWISVDEPVVGDVSISGYSVSLDGNAAVGGNARIASRSIDIDAPVTGSLLAVARNVIINSEITGDVMLAVDNLTFGPNAKIDGVLVYAGPRSIEIPESVISPDRVTHQKIAGVALSTLARMTVAGEALHDIRENGGVRTAAEIAATKEALSLAARDHDDHPAGLLAGLLATVVIDLIILALFLKFLPVETEIVRTRLTQRPLASFGYGLLVLSMLIGSIPVAAMTIVGLAVVPFLLIITAATCLIAYVAAVYALAWRVATAVKPLQTSMTNRLLATAAGVVVLSLTHYLGIFGWLINLAIVIVGLGGLVPLWGHAQGLRGERRRGEQTEPDPTVSEPTTPPELPGEDTPPRIG